jgi:hypothetical protein
MDASRPSEVIRGKQEQSLAASAIDQDFAPRGQRLRQTGASSQSPVPPPYNDSAITLAPPLGSGGGGEPGCATEAGVDGGLSGRFSGALSKGVAQAASASAATQPHRPLARGLEPWCMKAGST